MKKLSDLQEGEKGYIKNLLCNGKLRNRLLDMGFVEGVEILCDRRNSLTGPMIVSLKDYNLALGKEATDNIIVVSKE